MNKKIILILAGLALSCWGETRDEAIGNFKAKVALAKKTGDKKFIAKMEETLKCYEDKTAVKDSEVAMCQTIFLNSSDQKRLETLPGS